MRIAALVLAMIAASSLASAQATSSLTADAAQKIVAGCASHAASKRQSHAIAVVDTGGHLIAALRMDGNASGIFDFALAKAEAVAAWGFSTAQMADAAKATPGFGQAPDVVMKILTEMYFGAVVTGRLKAWVDAVAIHDAPGFLRPAEEAQIELSSKLLAEAITVPSLSPELVEKLHELETGK